jgi:hypothetical protein
MAKQENYCNKCKYFNCLDSFDETNTRIMAINGGSKIEIMVGKPVDDCPIIPLGSDGNFTKRFILDASTHQLLTESGEQALLEHDFINNLGLTYLLHMNPENETRAEV